MTAGDRRKKLLPAISHTCSGSGQVVIPAGRDITLQACRGGTKHSHTQRVKFGSNTPAPNCMHYENNTITKKKHIKWSL